MMDTGFMVEYNIDNWEKCEINVTPMLDIFCRNLSFGLVLVINTKLVSNVFFVN